MLFVLVAFFQAFDLTNVTELLNALLKALSSWYCQLDSAAAAHRTVMPSVVHSTQQYENNRAEVSHQLTRQRENQMRRFTSVGHAQRFLSAHGPVQNLFRCGRHVLRAAHHRLLRTRAFVEWDAVTCVC